MAAPGKGRPLQAVDFGSYYLEWLVMAPEWQEHYFSTDQTPTYRYLKKMLQVLTWLKGPNRWLIKCPQHMEQLIPLTRHEIRRLLTGLTRQLAAPAAQLHWSRWRRRHQATARNCHHRRRAQMPA